MFVHVCMCTGNELALGTNAGEVSVLDMKDLSQKALVDLNNFGQRKVTDQLEYVRA